MMDAKTLEALKGSIEKWEKIAAGDGVDEGSENCPLCQLFANSDVATMCDGCPVAKTSGKRGCFGTPYWDFANLKYPDTEMTLSDLGMIAVSDKAKAAALAERDFLKSLLPEES